MHRQKMLKGNTDTLLPLKVGPRLLQIGLLTVTASTLMIITAASLPVSLSALAVVLMIVASLAFLSSPAILNSKLERRQYEANGIGEMPDPWPPEGGHPSL